MFDDIPEKLAGAVRELLDEDRDYVRYATAAGYVIAQYLQKNFADEDTDRFLDRSTLNNSDVSYRFTIKLTMIGETLFNLRKSVGFSEFCRRLKDRDLRSTFYELFAANIMQIGGFEINARPEVQILGKDFDFDASRGSDLVSVEVTALTSTNFSLNTVRNALN